MKVNGTKYTMGSFRVPTDTGNRELYRKSSKALPYTGKVQECHNLIIYTGKATNVREEIADRVFICVCTKLTSCDGHVTSISSPNKLAPNWLYQVWRAY